MTPSDPEPLLPPDADEPVELTPAPDGADLPVAHRVPAAGPPAEAGMPVARRVRRPPEPGFLLSIAWCCGFLAALYIPALAAGLATFAAMALADKNPSGFLRSERDGFQRVVQHIQGKQPGDPPPMPPGVSYAIAAGIAGGHAGTLAMALLVLRFAVGRDWPRKIALRRPPVVPLVLSVLVMPGLMLTHAAVHLSLHKLFGGDPGGTEAGLKSMLAPWPGWLAVLLIGVGPGVIEELWCRGFLGRGLVGRYGVAGGVALTSMLFGALHLDPLYALGTMVMGVLLHLSYLASRSLWVPILLHFLNNTLTVLSVVLTSAPQGLQQGPDDVPYYVYLLGVALTLVGMWALWSCRGRLVPAAGEGADPATLWRPAFPGVELPPAGSGVVVRHGWPNPLAVLLTLAAFGGVVYFLAS